MEDTLKMEYWLPISMWNLNELFTTESISPFAFYQQRGFGNPSTRQREVGENLHFLTLYRHAPLSGPALKISPALLEAPYLRHSPYYSHYFKTIFLKRGSFVCYFEESAQIKMLELNSRMLLEVKAIEKHSFKGELAFEPFQCYHPKIKRMPIEDVSNLVIDYPAEDYEPLQDRVKNQIKGFIFGLYRGILSQPSHKAVVLENLLRAWRNTIGTSRTNMAMSSNYEPNWAEEIYRYWQEIIPLYPNESSGQRESLDIMRLRLEEIDRLYLHKAEELALQNAPSYLQEYEQCKIDIERSQRRLWAYEDHVGISKAKAEIQQIKDMERKNGMAEGKSRTYFAKTSGEYGRKQELKALIAGLSTDSGYASLVRELSRLEERLKTFRFGGSQYDSTIDDQFSRVAGLVSDLLDSTKSRAQVRRSEKRFPKLAGLIIRPERLIQYQRARDNTKTDIPTIIEQLPDELNLDSSEKNLLLLALNGALCCAAEGRGNISNAQILDFTEKLGVNLKSQAPADEQTPYSIAHLRDYLKYKHGTSEAFDFPEKNQVLQNIFAFMLRPNGFESMEKLLNEKGISPNYYATTIWASLIGFAEMPKTFTEVVYTGALEEHFRELDQQLEYCFLPFDRR